MKRANNNKQEAKRKMSWMNFAKSSCATSQDRERNKSGDKEGIQVGNQHDDKENQFDEKQKMSNRQAETNLAVFEG